MLLEVIISGTRLLEINTNIKKQSEAGCPGAVEFATDPHGAEVEHGAGDRPAFVSFPNQACALMLLMETPR